MAKNTAKFSKKAGKKTKWTRENIEKLIELYEAKPQLYDCKRKDFKDKDLRDKNLEFIAKEIGIGKDETKKKENSRAENNLGWRVR